VGFFYKKFLAESENYKVTSEYESVYLEFKNSDRESIYIGDFYGDPTGAIISKGERYVAMSGYGIIIYKLNEPFAEFKYDTSSEQYIEFKNKPEDFLDTFGLHTYLAESEKYFRFIGVQGAKDNIEHTLFRLNSENLDLELISENPHSRME